MRWKESVWGCMKADGIASGGAWQHGACALWFQSSGGDGAQRGGAPYEGERARKHVDESQWA